jgi:hypothetical protein
VLVATVNPLTATTPATGRVAFHDGSRDLGAVALHSYQSTSYAILFTTLPPGTHQVTATYTGDSTFKPSTSDPTALPVAAPCETGCNPPRPSQ